MSVLLVGFVVALVPVVLLLMADGCRASRAKFIELHVRSDSNVVERPGVSPRPPENVSITSGTALLKAPSGTAQEFLITSDPYREEIKATEEMVRGASEPYEWRIECQIDYESTGPTRPARGTFSAQVEFTWNGEDRNLPAYFDLRLVDKSWDRGLAVPSPTRIPDYQWEFTGIAG